MRFMSIGIEAKRWRVDLNLPAVNWLGICGTGGIGEGVDWNPNGKPVACVITGEGPIKPVG